MSTTIKALLQTLTDGVEGFADKLRAAGPIDPPESFTGGSE